MKAKLKQGLLASGMAVVMGTGLLTACSDDDKNPSVSKEQVTAQYVNVAHSAYADSLKTAKALQTAVDAFLAAPSTTTLNAAKAAYKLARIPYQQAEITRFDTDLTASTNTGAEGIASVDDWEGQVNAWPLDEGFIDYVDGTPNSGIIGGSQTIDKALLVGQNGAQGNDANVATGVHAIEFLLWGQDLNDTDAGAGNRPASDYISGEGCTNGNCDRRRTYLKVVTDLLVEDLENMVAEWDSAARTTDGTLAYNFLNNDEAFKSILFSMSVMAAAELGEARLKAAEEAMDPEEEHDCFSDLTHIAVANNLQGIRNAFFGSYSSTNSEFNTSGPSIASLIRQASPEAYNVLKARFDSLQTRMDQLVALGESSPTPTRFDQIIGLEETSAERVNVRAMVRELVLLSGNIKTASTLLGLGELGDGEGD